MEKTRERNVPSIPEASASISADLEVSPNEWLSFSSGGSIWAGVWLTGNNPPEGWNSIENGASFPLPGARPFSLIGNFNQGQNFYIGRSNATMAGTISDPSNLFLRTNDNVPGNGSGMFNCQVQVWRKLADAEADFVSQSFPATMLQGETKTVSITMKNTGTSTWNAANGYAIGPEPDGVLFGVSHRSVTGDVPPGASATFTFDITAPAAGTYNLKWRMLQEGLQRFGDVTDNVSITVLSPTNQAQFISQSVPGSMYTFEPYSVSVTMKNIGNTTWQAGTLFALGSQNPQDNTRWGMSRVPLPNPVAPGAQVTFSFIVNAPATPGKYNFQWRMVQDNVGWFGDLTPNVQVSVKNQPCARC